MPGPPPAPTLLTMDTLEAWAEVAGVVAVAPLLVGWLPAVGHRKRSASDLYLLVYGYWMALMPVINGACAWFAAWRLHLAHGSATEPAAIVAGVLFAGQTVPMFYLLALGAAMGGESQGHTPVKRPFRYACAMFYNWAFAAYLLSIPFAMIVTAAGWLGGQAGS